MTRKRIQHEKISNEGKRNAVFGKRADGLLKKANQLSILCGVDIAIIAHKHERESSAILWPTPEVCRDRLHKFLQISDLERAKKMVTHEKYMEQTVNSETENLCKYKRRADKKESQQLLHELSRGKHIEELDLYQLNELQSLSEEMLKRLHKMDPHDQVISNGRQQWESSPVPSPPSPPTFTPPPRMAVATQQQYGGVASMLDYTEMMGLGTETSSSSGVPKLAQNLMRNERWFAESMSEERRHH